MKYNINTGQMEALINKMGGIENFKRALSGKLTKISCSWNVRWTFNGGKSEFTVVSIGELGFTDRPSHMEVYCRACDNGLQPLTNAEAHMIAGYLEKGENLAALIRPRYSEETGEAFELYEINGGEKPEQAKVKHFVGQYMEFMLKDEVVFRIRK